MSGNADSPMIVDTKELLAPVPSSLLIGPQVRKEDEGLSDCLIGKGHNSNPKPPNIVNIATEEGSEGVNQLVIYHKANSGRSGRSLTKGGEDNVCPRHRSSLRDALRRHHPEGWKMEQH